MPAIYGGDEVSAIVLDCGSHTLRVGWAGEDTPRGVLPTSYGYLPDEDEGKDAGPSNSEEVNGNGKADGDTTMDGPEGAEAGQETTSKDGADATPSAKASAYRSKWKERIYAEKRKRYLGDMGVNMYRPDMEIASPLNEEGVLTSLPSMFAESEFALRKTLSADPREHPLMATEPSWNSKDAREIMTEIAFEGLGVPAFYLANSTVLSAFAAGKPTALVIDIGESHMSAIPVVDGFILRKGIHRQPIGGRAVSKALLYSVNNPPQHNVRLGNTEVVPQYLVQAKVAVDPGRPAQPTLREDRLKASTPSFRMYQTLRVIDDMKESCAQVLEGFWDDASALQRPNKTFEFPDGYNDTFGIERLRAPEILFTPKLWEGVTDVLPQPSEPYLGIADLALAAINATDVDSRANLLSNVVCVGGTTALPGFTDRLSYEMGVKAAGQKIKIHAPGNYVERRYSSWIGGSILASLGTFHQLWISRQEWEEHGNAIVHARCK